MVVLLESFVLVAQKKQVRDDRVRMVEMTFLLV